MSTELRLNAQVVCTDGPAGHLTDVILNPSNERVSHLVVELKGFGHFQHLVPVFTGAGKRHPLRVTALHACGVSKTPRSSPKPNQSLSLQAPRGCWPTR